MVDANIPLQQLRLAVIQPPPPRGEEAEEAWGHVLAQVRPQAVGTRRVLVGNKLYSLLFITLLLIKIKLINYYIINKNKVYFLFYC